MDIIEKNKLMADLRGLTVLITAARPSDSVTQMNFPVVGTTVIIPSLPNLGIAALMQFDCMERLAKILERVIEAS